MRTEQVSLVYIAFIEDRRREYRVLYIANVQTIENTTCFRTMAYVFKGFGTVLTS